MIPLIMSSIRDQMDIYSDFTYLNNAAIGLLPRKTYEVMINEIKIQHKLGEAGLNFENLLNEWNDTQTNISKLIGGQPDGVTLTTNTASGLHIVADGLQQSFRSGQNIVIPDSEFSTNSYVWQQLARRRGLELRTIPYLSGARSFEDWAHAIDQKTALVAVSSIQYSDGYKTDLKSLSELVHDAGGKIVVDAIQQVGNTPLNVIGSDIDFVSSGGYKWQLSPIGTGFFYVKPSLIYELDSILVGWFSSNNIMNMTHNPFVPGIGAKRYQQSLNPQLKAYNTSIKILLEWGVKNINNHVNSLIDYFVSNLPDKYTVASDRSLEHRSCIIKLDFEDAEKKVDQLKQEKVFVSYRDGGIRVSPHFYNTWEDIDRLLSLL